MNETTFNISFADLLPVVLFHSINVCPSISYGFDAKL